MSMFDFESEEDLIALLCNIANRDELVMSALSDDLKESWSNSELGMFQEMGMYSAVESDYKEPKSYKSMLKRPEEVRNKWLEGCKKGTTGLCQKTGLEDNQDARSTSWKNTHRQ